MAVDTGILLCGTTVGSFADVVGISGFGGERRTVENAKGSQAGSFVTYLFSCLRRGLPFNVTVVFSPGYDWVDALGDDPASITITWPVESGGSSAGTCAWKVGMTRFVVGGMLEDRVMAEITLQPTGSPTFTAGS